MKGTYQGSGGKSESMSKRGNVSGGSKGGSKGGTSFFHNSTMKNTEGVGSKLDICRKQTS